MSIRLELISQLARIDNTIAVFTFDNEQSEFADRPEIIERFVRAKAIIENTLPYLAMVDDLLFGEITEDVFMKRWSAYDKAREERRAVETISPQVLDFLKKAGDEYDKGESN